MFKVAAIVVVIALAVVGVIAFVGGDDDAEEASVSGPPGYEFTMLQPDGWTAVEEDELALIPGKPLAVLRRGEGEGLVTVNAPTRQQEDLDDVAAQLDERLSREIADFRKVGARVAQVGAGQGLLYSYARTKRGTAHTLLVVPTAERTYTVSAAVPAGAEDAAKDVGRILLSFDV